jgi:hypothetical protein
MGVWPGTATRVLDGDNDNDNDNDNDDDDDP